MKRKITFDVVHRDSFPRQVFIRLAFDSDREGDVFDTLEDCKAVIKNTMPMDVFVSLEVLNQESIEDTQEVDSKTQKISRIKEIIAEWGSTSTAELEADHSPCISSSGTNKMNVSVLVERFNYEDVGIFTYNNETEVAEDDQPYEALSEDVIDEILDLLEDYDTDNFKTMKRCED